MTREERIERPEKKSRRTENSGTSTFTNRKSSADSLPNGESMAALHVFALKIEGTRKTP